MKHSAYWYLLLTLTLPLTAGGVEVLGARARMQLFTELVPPDPGYFLADSLPGAPLLTPTELDVKFRNKKFNPSDPKIDWINLAVNYWIQQDFDAAILCVQRARNDADEETLRILTRFEPWIDEQAGRYAVAEHAWGRLASQYPDEPELLTRHFSCLLQQRKFGAAEALLDRLDEENPHHQLLRAIFYFGQGDAFEARHLLQEIAAQHEAPTEAFLGLAMLSLQESAVDDTLGWLREALSRAVPRDRLRFANLACFAALQTDPRFPVLLDEFEITRYAGEIPAEELRGIPTAPIAFYVEKHRIPDSMLINLRMRIHQPTRKVGGDILPFDRLPDQPGRGRR